MTFLGLKSKQFISFHSIKKPEEKSLVPSGSIHSSFVALYFHGYISFLSFSLYFFFSSSSFHLSLPREMRSIFLMNSHVSIYVSASAEIPQSYILD